MSSVATCIEEKLQPNMASGGNSVFFLWNMSTVGAICGDLSAKHITQTNSSCNIREIQCISS